MMSATRNDVRFASVMVQLAIFVLLVSTDPLTRPKLLIKGGQYQPIATTKSTLVPTTALKMKKLGCVKRFSATCEPANEKKCPEVRCNAVDDGRPRFQPCRLLCRRSGSVWPPRHKYRAEKEDCCCSDVLKAFGLVKEATQQVKMQS